MQPAMVIVGAGQAGVAGAVALREKGWHGRIVLIGAEPHLPYERPPLSKAAMTARALIGPKVILDETALQSYGIHPIACRTAITLDRAAHVVRLDDGQEIGYVRLLLATGARPRMLPDGIARADGVQTLRTFDDALSIRAALRPGSRLIIVGGGFIGLELAASAVQRDVATTVVEAAPRLLMRGVPASIATLIESQHRQAGVNILTGAQVRSIDCGVDGKNLSLKDGPALQADSIIVGIGAIPNTALAESAGIEIDNGIAVDEYLSTSDPDIFAAGDCCSFPHDLYGGRRVRLEAWRNACDQGPVAAANMMGKMERYQAVPWFWSEHYDRTLQVAGLTEYVATEVERPLPQDGLLVHGLARDGRVLCVSAFGRLKHVAREVGAAQALIARQAKSAIESIIEPVVPLASYVARA